MSIDRSFAFKGFSAVACHTAWATRRTGLEPATTGSTVRDSIQLSYRPRVESHYSNSITPPVKNLHFASIQRVLMADSTTSGTRKAIADSIRFVMNWRSGSACSCGASKTSSS